MSKNEVAYNPVHANSFLHKAADIFFTSFRLLRRLLPGKRSGTVIISVHKLGDSIFTLPALKILLSNKDYQNPTIITFHENMVIYRKVFPHADYLIINRSDFLFSGRILHPALWLKFFALPAKHFFDFSGGIHSAGIVFLSPAKIKVGINQKLYRGVFDHFVPIRELPHIMDIYLDVVRDYLRVIPPANSKVFPLQVNSIKKILIAPLGGWKAKEWGINRFINLASILKQNFDIHFVFETGSISDDIKAALREESITFSETKDIESLLGCISEHDLFLSNDTGPLYIANYSGRATFAIYGPTNPEYHLPYGKGHGYAMRKISCSPINKKFCDEIGGRSCFHFTCMNVLSVSDVYKQVSEFIGAFNGEKTVA